MRRGDPSPSALCGGDGTSGRAAPPSPPTRSGAAVAAAGARLLRRGVADEVGRCTSRGAPGGWGAVGWVWGLSIDVQR